MRGEFGPLLPAWWADNPSPRRRRTVRDWTVDSALFALPLMVTGLTVLAAVLANGSAGGWTLLDAVAGPLAATALWLRRRWPVGIALGLLPLAAVSPMAMVSATIAGFGVAAHRRFRVAVAVASAATIASVINFLIRSSVMPLWTAVLVAVLIGAVLTACGQFLRARRLLVLSLHDQIERAAAEQRLRVVQARHDERTRIAREMHDVLAHRMSLLSMSAGALAFRTDVPPDELARTAEVIRDSAHRALVDLRQVIGVLRDDEDESGATVRPQPTLAEIPTLIAEARASGDRIDTAVDTEIPDMPTDIEPSVGRNAYRVLQEALTNARKHATGEIVHVSVGRDHDAILIEVRNRTVARPTTIPGCGVGLVGLSERVRLAEGELRYGRADGQFTLRARLPFRA